MFHGICKDTEEEQTLDHPISLRNEVAQEWSTAGAQDNSLTYVAFADVRERNVSSVRGWIATANAQAAQDSVRAPDNAIYKQRVSKYIRLLQQLRHGGATHAAILQYNKKNEPSLIRRESPKGKHNAYTWLKKNAQKTITVL